ncbi:MAG TPA: type II toxin-antitoxin system VapB family antitoxin [Acidobacteriaceae bacterium]
MRTNIDIDDGLMEKALRASGAKTKKAAVEEGLELLVRLKEQEKIRELRGKVEWEGDLEQSRLSRFADRSW